MPDQSNTPVRIDDTPTSPRGSVELGELVLARARSQLDELIALAEKAKNGGPRAMLYFAWRANAVRKWIEFDADLFRIEIEKALAAERSSSAQ